MNVSESLSASSTPLSLHSHFAAKSARAHKSSSPGTPLIAPSASQRLSTSAPASPTVATGPSAIVFPADGAPTGTTTPRRASVDDGSAGGGGGVVTEKVLSDMASASWRDILGGLSAMLGACEQEAVVQYVLKAYQTFAATCGEMELDHARDALLVSLCQFSLPGWKPSSGVGTTVMTSIVEAGWRVGAHKRTTLTRKHILVRRVWGVAIPSACRAVFGGDVAWWWCGVRVERALGKSHVFSDDFTGVAPAACCRSSRRCSTSRTALARC